MTDKEEKEAYGSDTAAETAFKDSGNHQFDGLELQPYTPARIWAADAMNLRYGHIDEAGLSQFEQEKIYPGAVSDVGIVMWLCSIKDDARIDRARRDPITATKEAAAWANERGIGNANQKKFWDAYLVFLRIMSEIRASTGEPEKKTETSQTATTT